MEAGTAYLLCTVWLGCRMVPGTYGRRNRRKRGINSVLSDTKVSGLSMHIVSGEHSRYRYRHRYRYIDTDIGTDLDLDRP